MQMTTIAGIVGILLMLILMFAGVNLAFSFFISGFIGVVMILGFGGGLTYLQTIPVTTAMSYSLAVLPMFMLMGDFAVMGALTTDAYGAARKWFGRLPGGLAITSTVASAIFGAICGSGQATAMVMSQVAWPEMKRYGYEAQAGSVFHCRRRPSRDSDSAQYADHHLRHPGPDLRWQALYGRMAAWNPFDPPAVYHHGRFSQTQTRLGPARREDDSDGKASFLKSRLADPSFGRLYHGVHLGRHYHGE